MTLLASVIAGLCGLFGVAVGFMGGSARYASRMAVIEAQYLTLKGDIGVLSGKVDALAMRFGPHAYTPAPG